MKNHLNLMCRHLLVLAFLLSGHVYAQNYILKIKNTNGTVKEVNLADLNRITLAEANMNLIFKNAPIESLALSSVQCMTFSTATGVAPLFGTVASVSPNPARNYILIKNLTVQENPVLIYNAAGTLVKSVDAGNVTQHIDVSNFSRGIYFIRINNQILKFIKL